MIHYFIVNPFAGKESPERLIPAIESACVDSGVQYRIHKTTSKQDCLDFVGKITSRGEPVRVYAAGGDGTLNDVLNGVVDFENTEIGSIPCGTGNDFVKSIDSPRETMLKFERQITAPSQRVDCIQVNDRLCLNICNIGLDANTAYYMQKIKRIPLLNKASYSIALGMSVCRRLGNPLRVEFDDGTVVDRYLSLAVFGNGKYYGGSFKAAPEAAVNDGLIDVCLVNEVDIFTFLKFVGRYRQGQHVHDPELAGIILYKTAQSVTVTSPKNIRVCFDGEVIQSQKVVLHNLPGKVRFIIPCAE